MIPHRNKTTRVHHHKKVQIDWILNLLDSIPKQSLNRSNLKRVKEPQIRTVIEQGPVKSGILLTYDPDYAKFMKRKVCLYHNLIVIFGEESSEKSEEAFYLVCSETILQRNNLSYKEHDAYGHQLSDPMGNTYLFYEDYGSCAEWYDQMKRYFKLPNFVKKYQIKEKNNIPNFYTIEKISSNREQILVAQIHRLENLNKHVSSLEALMNEIGVYMCTPMQPFFLPFKQLYEDESRLYIVYEYFSVDRLSQLQTPFEAAVSNYIILQVIKAAKFLQNHGLYHGMISPHSILISKTNNKKVMLYSFAFREQNQRDMYWLLKRMPKGWVPPEFTQIYEHMSMLDRKAVKLLSPSLTFAGLDTYHVGCTLYYMTGVTVRGTVKATMDRMKIDFSYLDNNKQEFNISSSQMALMEQLLDQEPANRLPLIYASKHPWFLKKTPRQKPKGQKLSGLQSLRTIIEIREQSSFDISTQLRVRAEADLDSSEGEYDENENLHRISNEENYLVDMLQQLNVGVTQASRNIQMGN